MRFDPGSWIKRRMEETRRELRQQSFDLELYLHPCLMDLEAWHEYWYAVEAA